MFSPRERDFLDRLVRSRTAGDRDAPDLERAFPNPIYRRKLLWGIRRKASQGAADWELYLRAARVDTRVLPGSRGPDPPPLATEPMVSLGRALRSLVRRSRRPPTGPRGSVEREARR